MARQLATHYALSSALTKFAAFFVGHLIENRLPDQGAVLVATFLAIHQFLHQ